MHTTEGKDGSLPSLGRSAPSIQEIAMDDRRYQIVMSWDGTPQASLTFESGARIRVGDDLGATFFLPSDLVETPFDLIETRAGRLWVRVPERGRMIVEGAEIQDGLVVLDGGVKAQVELGAFSFFIAETEVVQALPRSALSINGWRWVAASFGVHAVIATLMFLSPPAAGALSLDITDASRRYIQVHVDADERQPVDPEDVLDSLSTGGAQSGQPSPGESGTAGERSSADNSGGQIRVRGRAQDHRVPLTRDSIAQMGVIRLASSLTFSDVSSPYGAPNAQGAFENSAYGAIMASQVGMSNGMGGLDMTGTGRGGGCEPGQPCGAGTVGVGGLGTGFGTCDQAQFRSLESRFGHAGAVDRCAPGAYGGGAGIGVNGTHRRHCQSCAPTLRMAEASTAGGLSREAIRRVVTRNRAQIRHCYETALRNRPDLAGRVSIQWSIHPEGRVLGARIVSSELRDSGAESCMQQSVGRWQFPAAEGATMVSYPFIFEAN